MITLTQCAHGRAQTRTPAQCSMNSMEENDICGIEKMNSNTKVKI